MCLTHVFFRRIHLFRLCSGYMISSSTSNVTLALSLAPVILVPFMLFGGFFLNSGWAHCDCYLMCSVQICDRFLSVLFHYWHHFVSHSSVQWRGLAKKIFSPFLIASELPHILWKWVPSVSREMWNALQCFGNFIVRLYVRRTQAYSDFS